MHLPIEADAFQPAARCRAGREGHERSAGHDLRCSSSTRKEDETRSAASDMGRTRHRDGEGWEERSASKGKRGRTSEEKRWRHTCGVDQTYVKIGY